MDMIWRISLSEVSEEDNMNEHKYCDVNNSRYLPPELAQDALYSIYEKVVVTAIIPITFIIGFIGNLGFLFVLLRLKYMRNITNFYLGNLAVADLTFIIIMTLRYTWFYANSYVDFSVSFDSSFGCVTSTFVVYLSIFSSFAFVTLVTVERYYAICKPLRHRIVSGRKHSLKLVLVTWLLCSFLAGLYTPSSAILKSLCIEWPDEEDFESLPTKVSRCEAMQPWMEPIALYLKAIVYWTSLTIYTIMGVKIIMKLTRRMSLTEESQCQTKQSLKSEMKIVRNQVAKMLIINNTVFFVLHGLYHISNIIQIIEMHLGYHVIGICQYQNLLWVGKVAAIINSAINPIIFNVTNPRYREAFTICFGCRKRSTEKYATERNTKELYHTCIQKTTDTAELCM